MAYKNCYHVTCSPKYRKNAISPLIWNRLKEVICNVANKREEKIYAIGGDKDHIHILIETNEISKSRNSIFSASSRIIRREFPELLDINESSFLDKITS